MLLPHRLLAMLMLLLSAAAASGQSLNDLPDDREAPDTADVARLERKAFWRASAETVGMNLSLWAFDRFVQKGHYAYISWESIRDNFRHGFEWDNDHLGTNMFAHPYNGSIFYNAGRSNGFNYWQSELFAIGGSAMWEMFMECEYPSTNDIIATPVGGAAIGEVLYRASDLIINDRTTGVERFGRECAAFLVNPMRGFNRLVTGRAWTRRATSGRRFGLPHISVETFLGGRMLSLYDNDEATRAGASAELFIEYGDRFAARARAPYDYFSFLLELQAMKSQPLLSRVEIIGRLLSREIVDWRGLGVGLGMYQHFDYFDSDTIHSYESRNLTMPCNVPYKLGTPACLGAGMMARYAPSPRWSIYGYLHANWVGMAGVLTDFYRNYHRNYSWGTGFSFKTGLNLIFDSGRWKLILANQHYKIYSRRDFEADEVWNPRPGTDVGLIRGDGANVSFNHFEAQATYRIYRRLAVSGGFDLYTRQSHYFGMEIMQGNSWISSPIIESKQMGFHLGLAYTI